jgi:adenosylmethionine-8-amino-7-oxononanoate aminotransferase
MSHILSRATGLPLRFAVRGDGPYVIDRDGKRYLDACGGAAISCLGHSEQTVIRAIQRQLGELPFAYGVFFTTEAVEKLAEDLVSDAPAGLKPAGLKPPDLKPPDLKPPDLKPPDLTKVFFGSGGSEQMDGTLKLARQYCVDAGEAQRVRFIARRQSYHGGSMGSLGVGGHARRRELYLPLLASAEHIAPCYAYRNQEPGESAEAYGLRAANALEEALLRVGPETVIAFVAEPVVGAAMGCVPAAPGYFRRIREICDRYGVLLIADEVMCGLGRTGYRYACDEDGVVPDLLVVAKGLGAGYQPISATLVSERIHDTIQKKRGYFMHGHSYQGHAAACAGALAVQQVIREQGLIDNVRRQGALLRELLVQRFGGNPHVGDIRGRGLLIGLELVKNRETKEPFEPEHALWRRVMIAGMEHGLMCYPGGGTADGTRGDHILLAPPFNVNAEHVEEAVEKLGAAVDQALALT